MCKFVQAKIINYVFKSKHTTHSICSIVMNCVVLIGMHKSLINLQNFLQGDNLVKIFREQDFSIPPHFSLYVAYWMYTKLNGMI